MFNGKVLNVFTLRLRTKKACPLSQLIINMMLEIPASAIRQEKEIRDTATRKE
jgi:hypothetical protein